MTNSTAAKPAILLVDDNRKVLRTLEMLLAEDYLTISVESGHQAIAALSENKHITACVLDVRMPEMDGFQTARELSKIDPELPVIIHTAYAGDFNEDDVYANSSPYDFIPKGDSVSRLLNAVKRAVESYLLKTGGGDIFEHAEKYWGIISQAREMLEPLRLIRQLSMSESKVMILGESGTGKELVARAIHKESKRRDKRFGVYDCSHRSKELAASELFGHKKGTFTSAHSNRTGLIEWLDGGTILFDELGDLDQETQNRILRVVDTGQFRAVGSTIDQYVSLRILSATNRDLDQLVSTGKFRHDLYHRLRGSVINLPPLRMRSGDIPLLVQRFLDRFTVGQSLPPKVLDSFAMDAMVAHSWSANVRHLIHAIQSLVETTDSDIILEKDVHRVLNPPGREPNNSSLTSCGLKERERAFRKSCIIDALRESEGNIAAAARLLQVDRSNLRKWIIELEIRD